jgi:hypothetical protein
MTSSIIVDAHAGWDIEVTTREVSEKEYWDASQRKATEYTQTERRFIVEAGTKLTVHIWDGKSIIRIKEIKK